ncbi:MAG: alkaline phosphatase family protein, partial [Nocardioidaceae bacterium]
MRLVHHRSITSRGRPRRRTRAALGSVVLTAALVALPITSNGAQSPRTDAGSPAKSASHSTPHHVVFIVLDQLRPEFINAFDMENVKQLMKDGTSFPKAYLGHMASETVVSHNVMTSGILPKHMGWSDEWFRDVDGVLGEAGKTYVSGSLSAAQFDLLIEHGGYKKLPDYLHEKFPGTIVATVGQKSYATNSMGGPGADIRVTMGSRDKDCDVDASADTNWRGPAGTNVPAYITGTYVANTECSRFYINSNKSLNNHGTVATSPAWMYPLEGNRDVPGSDPAHYGGDVWTADAAMAIMDNENWSGLLITMGGIDKAGHMWGGLNDVPPYPGGDPDVHMASVAKTADDQVGRILQHLDDLGIRDDTLVVLTTDHAQLTGETYYGVDKAGQGNYNWYYGTASGTGENYLDPQPEIKRLIDQTDNVQMSMQDSAIRTWLIDQSKAKKKQAA